MALKNCLMNFCGWNINSVYVIHPPAGLSLFRWTRAAPKIRLVAVIRQLLRSLAGSSSPKVAHIRRESPHTNSLIITPRDLNWLSPSSIHPTSLSLTPAMHQKKRPSALCWLWSLTDSDWHALTHGNAPWWMRACVFHGAHQRARTCRFAKVLSDVSCIYLLYNVCGFCR